MQEIRNDTFDIRWGDEVETTFQTLGGVEQISHFSSDIINVPARGQPKVFRFLGQAFISSQVGASPVISDSYFEIFIGVGQTIFRQVARLVPGPGPNDVATVTLEFPAETVRVRWFGLVDYDGNPGDLITVKTAAIVGPLFPYSKTERRLDY